MAIAPHGVAGPPEQSLAPFCDSPEVFVWIGEILSQLSLFHTKHGRLGQPLSVTEMLQMQLLIISASLCWTLPAAACLSGAEEPDLATGLRLGGAAGLGGEGKRKTEMKDGTRKRIKEKEKKGRGVGWEYKKLKKRRKVKNRSMEKVFSYNTDPGTQKYIMRCQDALPIAILISISQSR